MKKELEASDPNMSEELAPLWLEALAAMLLIAWIAGVAVLLEKCFY